MKSIAEKCLEFIRKEAVLSIAVLLAVISCFIVTPDREYPGYIDFRTLGILFCLMAVMAGFQKIGVFQEIAGKLLSRIRGVRALVTVLVMLCFFFSMLITNDVALITFVPLTFTVLRMAGGDLFRKQAVPVVVLQTIAANLGSMLTPIGNPQNLYLYGKAGLNIGEFIFLMLPYTLIAFVMLLAGCMLRRKEQAEVTAAQLAALGKGQISKKSLSIYLVLFLLCILTVAGLIPYGITLVLVILAVLLSDRKVLGSVDYSLLLTFVGFFVFIGNMGRIPAFRGFLENIITGNEMLTAALSSQIISNVPAALLLSGFTSDYTALIVGTNLGGLGTLIASMASLISFKYIAKEDKDAKRWYLFAFTWHNLLFLAVLLMYYYIFG